MTSDITMVIAEIRFVYVVTLTLSMAVERVIDEVSIYTSHFLNLEEIAGNLMTKMRHNKHIVYN